MYLIYDCLETTKKSRRTALILPYFPWKHWSRPFYVIHWKKVLYTMMSILSCGITYDGKGEGAFIHHPDLKGGDNLLWAISASFAIRPSFLYGMWRPTYHEYLFLLPDTKYNFPRKNRPLSQSRPLTSCLLMYPSHQDPS